MTKSEIVATYFASLREAASRPGRPQGPTVAPNRRTGPHIQSLRML